MDSKLQIISGEFRGRKLKLPDGARPTQNLARGAIFNSLAAMLLEPFSEIHAWDAFAGSGALGIEVLSRYAESTAIFTDISDKSIYTITENINGLNIDLARYKIDKSDAATRIQKYADQVNLVFVDPPYSEPNLGINFVDAVADSGFHGIVVQEVENNVDYTPDATKWEILRDKTYGRARFLIMKKL